jgi:transcription initiation factor IIE alpha subunit
MTEGSMTIEEHLYCIMALLDTPLTAEELHQYTGYHPRTVKQRLEFMTFDNLISSSVRTWRPYTLEYSRKDQGDGVNRR